MSVKRPKRSLTEVRDYKLSSPVLAGKDLSRLPCTPGKPTYAHVVNMAHKRAKGVLLSVAEDESQHRGPM